VIADSAVATEYYYILSLLGIEYNVNKSFSEVGIAEFAKGYYRNGYNLKPITPDLLLHMSNMELLGKACSLVHELESKDFSLTLDRLLSIFPLKESELTTVLQFECKKWPFNNRVKHGIIGQDLQLSITRINSALLLLNSEEIHRRTSMYVVENRSTYGDKFYLSPYIQMGATNTKSFPPVRFPRDSGDYHDRLEILIGEGFIA
jgi:hypothetical protein